MWVTQMNHIPMHIDHDRNMDWVSTQVRHSHLKDLGITQLKGWVGTDPNLASLAGHFSPATMWRRE